MEADGRSRGQIVAKLKQHGLLEDTLIIVTSDNGSADWPAMVIPGDFLFGSAAHTLRPK